MYCFMLRKRIHTLALCLMKMSLFCDEIMTKVAEFKISGGVANLIFFCSQHVIIELNEI